MTEMTSKAEHVLLFGGGQGMPAMLRATAPGTTTTIMCRLRMVRRIRETGQQARVLGLRHDATDDEWVTLAQAVHAVHPVTRITVFGEMDQRRAAVVADRLGLPFHSERTVHLVYDKLSMREHLRSCGVDDTQARLIGSAEELQRFSEEVGGPVIVKPLDGVGSVGVALVRVPSDVVGAYGHAAQGFGDLLDSCHVIAETFHEGPQYSVEAFSEDGRHLVVAIVRKYLDPGSFVEIGHLVPAPLDDTERLAVSRLVERMLTALDIRYGPTHTEIVLTRNGPRVIETHLRLAGDDIPLLVKDAYGVDLAEYQVRQVLGESVLGDLEATLTANGARSRFAAIWFAVGPSWGRLVAVEDLPTPVAAPRVGSVVAVETLVPPGADLGESPGSFGRVASVRASGDTSEATLAAARAAVSTMRVVIARDGTAGIAPV